ncbi:MAG: nucleotidyltransferase family protein, partial [Myxococcales bacterium]|nr:nucleotidyltransferase family protein [Myxococcales bacterium]
MRLNPVLAHNLLLRAELVRIARRLAAAEIDFVVLKGVVLLQRVYGRLDARPVSDNDLLFRSADLERALAVLGELGYEPKVQQALPDALEGDAKYVLERRYHGRPLWLDLHTNALVPTIHRATEEPFWAHTETVQLDDVALRVFSPELTLLHLVAHAEQHRFCEPRILQDVIAAWNTWTRRDAASDATASDTPASA